MTAEKTFECPLWPGCDCPAGTVRLDCPGHTVTAPPQAARRREITAERIMQQMTNLQTRCDLALIELNGIVHDLRRIREDMATMHGVPIDG
jgi:hypothetical protein